MGNEVPEAVLLIIPLLVGGICVPLITFIKGVLKWTNPEDVTKNAWLSLGVSLLTSVLALFITNSFVPWSGEPAVVVGWITLTFATATMIYKNLPSARAAR